MPRSQPPSPASAISRGLLHSGTPVPAMRPHWAAPARRWWRSVTLVRHSIASKSWAQARRRCPQYKRSLTKRRANAWAGPPKGVTWSPVAASAERASAGHGRLCERGKRRSLAPGRMPLIEGRPEMPALPTAAIPVKAAATEKQEKHRDDQNGGHSGLQCRSSRISVRDACITSPVPDFVKQAGQLLVGASCFWLLSLRNPENEPISHVQWR